ncbi:Histone-lysine N-methyltransferase eggless, partial [Armadillidium nasatum]
EDNKEVANSSNIERKIKCLNPECKNISTNETLIKASDSVRRYYGVEAYYKKRKICTSCLHSFWIEKNNIIDLVKSGKNIFSNEITLSRKTFIISESDSDDSNVDNSSDDSECEFDVHQIKGVTKDSNFSSKSTLVRDDDLEEIQKKLAHLNVPSWKALILLSVNLCDDDYNSQASSFPRLEPISNVTENPLSSLPHTFTPNIVNPKSLKEPSLIPLSPANNCYSDYFHSQMNHSSTKLSDKTSYRLIESSSKTPIQLDTYTTTTTSLVEKSSLEKSNSEISEGVNEFGIKIVSAKNLAYFHESSVRVPLGTRIIASVEYSKCFYVGIVAEIPTVANKYRYLVFFDDGYAQYVRHSDIRIVAQDNINVWEDVEKRSQSFIKNYLETYPEKTMIRLQKYCYVQTELSGLFYRAQVIELDCSLAKMFFPVQKKYEWLYRGSSRFQPLFEKKLKYNQKMESETPNLTIRRRTVPVKKKAPVIEYVNLEEPSTDILTNLEQSCNDLNKNIAENKELIREHLILEQKGKESTFKDDLELEHTRFVSHQCNKECDINSSKHLQSKDVSPILKPILFGWRRQFTKIVKKTVTRDICLYVAPCGRRLRSYDEICLFLKITNSHFTIDMFTLDTEINLFRTWEPGVKKIFLQDITCDQEEVYISAVNSIDSSSPKEFKYCNEFIIDENVSVNLDPSYLVCCKCKDNCINKLECECWQLTIEAAKTLSSKTRININIGYNYKRLYEQVPSGIFECNAECSCKKSCLNRVVQFPIKQKLQLFKTAQRGWGVRTLHDIPNGTFLCTYVGKVITDTQANQEGRLEGGDEYFANLDYIEIVEEEKDGYESSVTDIEEENDEQSSLTSDNEKSSDSEDKKRKRRKNKYEVDKEFKLNTNLTITETRKKSSRIRHRPEIAEDEDSNDSIDSSKRESINFEPDELEDSELLINVPKKSLRDYYRETEAQYVLDAKRMGNIGRYLNHSCDPNVYCQNVFVSTHDPRFPRISFFASKHITAGTELTWDYNYEIDSIPDRFKKCYCRSTNCKGRLL